MKQRMAQRDSFFATRCGPGTHSLDSWGRDRDSKTPLTPQTRRWDSKVCCPSSSFGLAVEPTRRQEPDGIVEGQPCFPQPGPYAAGLTNSPIHWFEKPTSLRSSELPIPQDGANLYLD